MKWGSILIALIIGLTPQALASKSSSKNRRPDLIMEIDVKFCKPKPYFGHGRRAKCFLDYNSALKKLYVLKNRYNASSGLGYKCIDKKGVKFVIFDNSCKIAPIGRVLTLDDVKSFLSKKFSGFLKVFKAIIN